MRLSCTIGTSLCQHTLLTTFYAVSIPITLFLCCVISAAEKENTGSSAVAIAGGVSGVLLVCLVILGVVLLHKRRKSDSIKPHGNDHIEGDGNSCTNMASRDSFTSIHPLTMRGQNHERNSEADLVESSIEC